MNEEVLHYIQTAREYGISDAEIHDHLLQAGWHDQVIQENFILANQRASLSTQNILSKNANNVLPNSRLRVIKIVGWFLAVIALAAVVFVYLLVSGKRIFAYSLVDRFIRKSFTGTGTVSQNLRSKFTYTDLQSVEIPERTVTNQAIKFENFSVELAVDSQTSPEGSSQTKLDAALKNNGLSYSEVFELANAGDKTYLRITEPTENPGIAAELAKLFRTEINGKWIKINLPLTSNAMFTAEVSKRFGEGLIKHKVFKVASFKGMGKVGDKLAIHYTFQVNYPGLKAFFDSENVNKDEAKTVLDTMNRMKIEKFDVWTDLRAQSLLKLQIHGSLPSLASAIKVSLDQHSEELLANQNNQILSDIKAYKSALELYFNDNGGYPLAQNGVPTSLVPKYMTNLPTAPKSNGNCSEYYNTYWYSTEGKARKLADGVSAYPAYTLTFCLSLPTAGYEAGIGRLTPAGVTITKECADPSHACFIESQISNNPLATGKKKFLELVDFSAPFTFELESRDKSSIENFKEPENFISSDQLLSGFTLKSPIPAQIP